MYCRIQYSKICHRDHWSRMNHTFKHHLSIIMQLIIIFWSEPHLHSPKLCDCTGATNGPHSWLKLVHPGKNFIFINLNRLLKFWILQRTRTERPTNRCKCMYNNKNTIIRMRLHIVIFIIGYTFCLLHA